MARKKKTEKTVTIGGLKETVELKVSKFTEVNLSGDQEFIYFDRLKDGTWRMCRTCKK